MFSEVKIGMYVFIRKLYAKHKALTLTVIPVVILVVLFALICLSTYIPRTQNTDYTADTVKSNNFIREMPYLGINTSKPASAPADTLAYFKAVFEKNNSYRAEALEINIHMTRDKKPVVLSADTLDEISDSKALYNEKNLKPEEKTYEQLKRYNLGYYYKDANGAYPYRATNADFGSVRIMSLVEVLSYLEINAKNAWKTDFLYIFRIRSEKTAEEAVGALYEAIISYNIINRSLIVADNNRTASVIDGKYPNLKRTATQSEAAEFYLDCVFNVNLAQRKPSYKALLFNQYEFVVNLGKKSIIDYAHKYGIAVIYKTINKTENIKLLSNRGADIIITVNPLAAFNTLYR